MARIGRPIFRRGLEYVAVRPIRLTKNEVIEPGETVQLPVYRLQNLHRRRRIGPKGHPWTLDALETAGYPSNWVRPEKVKDAEPPVVEVDPAMPQEYTFGDGVIVTIQELFETACDMSNLDVVAFNALSSDNKIDLLGQVCEQIEELLTVELEDDAGDGDAGDADDADDADKNDSGNDDWLDGGDGTDVKIEQFEAIEPQKHGARWVLPGMTERKFTSAKKANEFKTRQIAKLKEEKNKSA